MKQYVKKAFIPLLMGLALIGTTAQAEAQLTVGNTHGTIDINGDDSANNVALVMDGSAQSLTITDLSGQPIGFGTTTGYSLEKLCPKELISANGATIVCKSIEGSESLYRVFDDPIEISLSEGNDSVLIEGTATSSAFNIYTGNGNDSVQTGSSNDYIVDNSGTDNFDTGEGEDIVMCSVGKESITASLTANTCTSNSETDTLLNVEGLIGSEGDDTLEGNDQSNTLAGNSGSDKLIGGGGDDTISVSGPNSDQVENNVDAGSGNDTVSGDSGDDTINAGEGDDTVFGYSGNDTIEGGNGNDTLYSGDGRDTVNGFIEPSIKPVTKTSKIKLRSIFKRGYFDMSFTCPDCNPGWTIDPEQLLRVDSAPPPELTNSTLHLTDRYGNYKGHLSMRDTFRKADTDNHRYTLRFTVKSKKELKKLRKLLKLKGLSGELTGGTISFRSTDQEGYGYQNIFTGAYNENQSLLIKR